MKVSAPKIIVNLILKRFEFFLGLIDVFSVFINFTFHVRYLCSTILQVFFFTLAIAHIFFCFLFYSVSYKMKPYFYLFFAKIDVFLSSLM